MSGFYDPDKPGFEPDIDDDGASAILIYVVVISALFFSSLGGLFIYFRWEADLEIAEKILRFESKDLKDVNAKAQAVLDGSTPVTEGGKAIKIEDAMQRTLQDFHATQPAAPDLKTEQKTEPKAEKAK